MPTFLFKEKYGQNKNRDEKSSLFAHYKICTKQLPKLLLPSFLLEEKNGAYFSFQRKVRSKKSGGRKTEMKKIISVFVCYSNMTVTGLSPTSILTEAAFAPQKLLLSASSAGVPSTVAEEALPKQSATV